MATTQTRTFAQLDTSMLYKLLKLRSDVFIVEQNCPYADIDGRDTESGTVHIWSEVDGQMASYLRVLSESDGYRIGRVCTGIPWRGMGLANRLVQEACRYTGDAPVRLDAQIDAVKLYLRNGFEVCGPQFIEDGIPHLPMCRNQTGRSS